ncbi:hypothetical protein AK812_SmicGene17766 [Symbiodinium microadriaticum]|uniref:Uncharacterized protein n=1 Tax=Symbiodinium microadriaticum TaxID=2951 RepID=A0A1Q9DWY7_SYMMI|nr:hypothetical protein AK812_SmicGene17766 [Symbiodinium microadriaticum]
MFLFLCAQRDPSSPYADIKQVQPLPRPATSAVLGACRSPPSGLVLPTREATSAAPTAMNLSAVKTPSMTLCFASLEAPAHFQNSRTQASQHEAQKQVGVEPNWKIRGML